MALFDPDAPARTGLQPDHRDVEEDTKFLLKLFTLLRCGKFDRVCVPLAIDGMKPSQAQEECCKRAQFWRAATLDGWRLWHDPNYCAYHLIIQ